MSPTRRIFLNVVATYGRSLYALVIGLFCGRWSLRALGEVDYGLFGLIGGLTLFVSFVNNLLSSAVGRFFAVAVGSARIEGNAEKGLDDCRKWFNTAFLVHLVLPLALTVVGYPAGVWAVEEFLSIPPDRVPDCLWVWRLTCAGCFVSMLSVPFGAMYMAKQEIAELTVYGFATTTANVIVLAYMITHDGTWLVPYAACMTGVSVLPSAILSFRAVRKYAECRFVRAYLWDAARVRELFSFAFARFWTALSQIVSTQGCAILVNKYLGPSFNAAISVGTSVSSHACTLSGAISGAFWPVIANKAGERDYDGMRRFAFQTCRLSTAMILIFAVPLAIEARLVLKLWLGTPPASAWAICTAVLVGLVMERMTEGYWMAVIGEGSHVSRYSLVVSVSGFSCFAFTWCFLGSGLGVLGYCAAIVFGWCVTVAVRLVLGRAFVAMSARHWLCRVFAPIATAVALSLPAGLLVRESLPESFLRVCLTTLACEAALVPLLWLLAFGRDERAFVTSRLRRLLPKLQ